MDAGYAAAFVVDAVDGGGVHGVGCGYSELTKTSTALARLAVLFVLSAARRLVLIFVNSL